jgi:uncharacterized damage-inducible protein DinB
MSRYTDSLIPEIEQEAATTRRVLERVPHDKMAWQPHPKSMTLGRLSHHVATIPGFFGKVLQGSSYDVNDFKDETREPASAAELVQLLDNSMVEARQLVRMLTDENAMAPWSFKRAGVVMMTAPRIVLVRSLMLNHWYHHRGQLSVNLRLLGVPVPAIYGPSADENPFA